MEGARDFADDHRERAGPCLQRVRVEGSVGADDRPENARRRDAADDAVRARRAPDRSVEARLAAGRAGRGGLSGGGDGGGVPRAIHSALAIRAICAAYALREPAAGGAQLPARRALPARAGAGGLARADRERFCPRVRPAGADAGPAPGLTARIDAGASHTDPRNQAAKRSPSCSNSSHASPLTTPHMHKGLKRNFQLMPGPQWLELLCRHIPDRFEHLEESGNWGRETIPSPALRGMPRALVTAR